MVMHQKNRFIWRRYFRKKQIDSGLELYKSTEMICYVIWDLFLDR